MEYFMPLATGAENAHEACVAARPAHLARLRKLKAQGRLLTAGPNPLSNNPGHISGGLIMAQFRPLDAAQKWAEQDPYADADVYAEVLIKLFKTVSK